MKYFLQQQWLLAGWLLQHASNQISCRRTATAPSAAAAATSEEAAFEEAGIFSRQL